MPARDSRKLPSGRRLSQSQPAGIPLFETLEPRLLLDGTETYPTGAEGLFFDLTLLQPSGEVVGVEQDTHQTTPASGGENIEQLDQALAQQQVDALNAAATTGQTSDDAQTDESFLYETAPSEVSQVQSLLTTRNPDDGQLGFQATSSSIDDIIPASRRVPWDPGVEGGIPNRTTIFASVKDAPYNAKGDGVTNDRAAIQAAINACPVGQVLYLPPGVYKVTAGSGVALQIAKGITLRGAGPNLTKILFGSSTSLNRIYMQNGDFETTSRSILSGYTKGSNQLTLSSVTGLSVGDFIYLDQLNDGTFVSNVGIGGTCTWCGRNNGTRSLNQFVRILAINGSTVTVDPPMYYTYSASLQPQATRYGTVVQNAGIEDIALEGGFRNVEMNGTANCWVKNVVSTSPMEEHVYVNVAWKCEIRDSDFEYALSYAGGYGYGVRLGMGTTANLVENNVFNHLHCSFYLGWGACGNVFAYNFSTDGLEGNAPDLVDPDLTQHGAHPMMNLIEGNYMVRSSGDAYCGTASNQTWYRNRILGYQPGVHQSIVTVALEQKNTYMNFVGNVLGTDGVSTIYEVENTSYDYYGPGVIFRLGYTNEGDTTPSGNDPNVKLTILRTGNFDYATDSVIWDPNIPDHDLPASLYLTSRPDFFGNYPWPYIGPDLTAMVGYLPAMDRFYGIKRYLPGDANGDTLINGQDLAIWRQHFDPIQAHVNTFYMGDWNNDGLIGGEDLALWQQHYDPIGYASVTISPDNLSLQPESLSSDLVRATAWSVPWLVDWNADGLTDLLVGEQAGNVGKVRVYLNQGTSKVTSFGAYSYVQSPGGDLWVPSAGCLGAFPRTVDYNGDGLTDLLLGRADGTVEVFLNVGTSAEPVFESGGQVQVGEGGAKSELNVGARATLDVTDWNNDGRWDLMVGALDGRIRLYLNEGSARAPDFGSAVVLQDTTGDLMVPTGRSSPVVVDLDGDGTNDVVSGNTEGQLVFYRNLGTADYPLFEEGQLLESGGEVINLDGSPRSRPCLTGFTSEGACEFLVGAMDGLLHWYQVRLESSSSVGTQVGDVAPDFALPSADGGVVRLDALRGDMVLLVFGATWCPNCADKIVMLKALQEQYGSQGFRVVMVYEGEDVGTVGAYAAEQGMNYTVLADVDKGVGEAYGIQAYPMSFLVDRTGRIQYAGYPDGTAIEAIVSGGAGTSTTLTESGGTPEQCSGTDYVNSAEALPLTGSSAAVIPVDDGSEAYAQGAIKSSGNGMDGSAEEDSSGEIIPADRRIEWEAGVPGGIPAWTIIFANVKDAPYNAEGDGVHDDTQAIQNAINACPQGQVVYLPPGTYKLTSTLTVFQKGIVLRGAGPDMTRLLQYSAADVIRFYSSSSSTVTNLTGGFTKGSNVVTVSSAANFKVGDMVLIDQLNDPSLVTITSYAGSCTWCSRSSGTRALGQIVLITAKNGNTLTLNRPLYYTFGTAFSPQMKKVTDNPVRYGGVEDLYVESVAGQAGSNIVLQFCVYTWVKNVESNMAYANHVSLYTSYGCEVRDSYFHHGHVYTGGKAYGLWLFEQSTDNLVENNIFYYLRHSVSIEAGGAGNVIGYNYSDRMFDDNYPNTDWMGTDYGTHGAHPLMNLWEGNMGSKIIEDIVWGSASHDTWFRNYMDVQSQGEGRAIIYARGAVEVQAYNTYMNFVGNVFGTPGVTGYYEVAGVSCSSSWYYVYKLGYEYASDCNPSGNDPNVKASLLRHGNFDYVTNTVIWDPNIPDHDLPASLYLTSRPDFFGNYPWPYIGPDLTAMVGYLPAMDRFYGIKRYLPGDANGDTLINGQDLAIWRQHFDPIQAHVNTFYMGDWNNDGLIGGEDLALWQQHYDPIGYASVTIPTDSPTSSQCTATEFTSVVQDIPLAATSSAVVPVVDGSQTEVPLQVSVGEGAPAVAVFDAGLGDVEQDATPVIAALTSLTVTPSGSVGLLVQTAAGSNQSSIASESTTSRNAEADPAALGDELVDLLALADLNVPLAGL